MAGKSKDLLERVFFFEHNWNFNQSDIQSFFELIHLLYCSDLKFIQAPLHERFTIGRNESGDAQLNFGRCGSWKVAAICKT